MTIDRSEYVHRFREAADQPSYSKLNPSPTQTNMVMNCIIEEFNEFVDAVAEYHKDHDSEVHRADLCKEWADLAYTVEQAAVYFEIPADEAFERVANNNLTKVSDDGKIKYREDGKVLKPEGYEPTDMRGL